MPLRYDWRRRLLLESLIYWKMVVSVLRRVCHFLDSDRQVFLNPITYCPAHNTAAVQVKNDGELEPALSSPYIADIARPFAVRCIGHEVAIQQVIS